MAFSEEIWAKAKLDYETGKESSIRKIGLKYDISKKAVEDRIKKDNWVKGELKDEVEKTLQDKFRDEFIKKGWNDGKVAEKVIEFLDAEKIAVIPSNTKDPETGEKEPGFTDVQPDRWAQNEGLKHYKDLTGAKLEKKEVNFIGSVDVNITFGKDGEEIEI